MKNRVYSEEIANAIRGFLDAEELNYFLNEQRGIILFGMDLVGKLQKVNCKIWIRDNNFTVYGCSPVNADADDELMMAEMARLIARVNYDMVRCHFEMDMRDGEILAKSFVPCDGITPTEEMVRRSVFSVIVAFMLNGDDIVDIIFGE